MDHDGVKAFLEHDQVTHGLGMEVLDEGLGHATVRMTVRADMLNGFGITHGGMVFCLADSAFALACNDLGDDSVVVAQQCEVDFLRPTRVGDVLTATATARHQALRSGIYDVDVTDGDQNLVATFRGRSRTAAGHSRPHNPGEKA